MTQYAHHRVSVTPRHWREVSGSLARAAFPGGGVLYGVWRSQIGRPRDELTVISHWPEETDPADVGAALAAIDDRVRHCETVMLVPTLRPTHPDPPRRQGNHAFRWFALPRGDWDEFEALCAAAWPGFEAAYDSQVIGLWRGPDGLPEGPRGPDLWWSLLLTRRPDLAMWERSKIPRDAAERETRDKLSRRYDLCDWTVVYTTTLLTAEDAPDEVRWA